MHALQTYTLCCTTQQSEAANISLLFAAEAWRAEVLQYIAENISKVALTSAFVERLQSEWSLEHIQQIAEAVKLEYGASRAGYALEVYLGLQRLQASAESGSFSEAEEVKELLEGLKVHQFHCVTLQSVLWSVLILQSVLFSGV